MELRDKKSFSTHVSPKMKGSKGLHMLKMIA